MITYDGRRPRILVAEDTEILRGLMGTMLRSMGCEVTLVDDGLKALEAVRSGAFDAVIMDGMMPVMSGAEATRRIRELDFPMGGVPIIGATAMASDEERGELLDAGMTFCLLKPVKPAELRAALEEIL